MSWYILGVNPEPWRVPNFDVGRKGGLHVVAGADQGLAAYQNAVRESLQGVSMLQGQIELRFYFWREQPRYKGSAKQVQKNQADATNMQKALEDALQGLLFENDRQVTSIHSEIVEQGPDVEPCIAIYAEEYHGFNPDSIPPGVWDRVQEVQHNVIPLFDNTWPPR